MKTIPSALQAHKDSRLNTLAHLVKITPVVGVTPAAVFGITSNSDDIIYDDGTGVLTYHASNGADLSNLASSLDLSVDNAEINSLLSEFDIGTITEADVLSGKLDYAEFVTYSVNWANLSDGHEIVQTGTLGEATTIDGLSVTLETRSLSQQLKRPIVEGDSITCRAIFGSMAGDPGVRFPCNFDTTAEWINITVTAVGAEPDLQFTVSGLAAADGFLAPGVIEWFTGANAGRTHEVERQTGAVIELIHPANFDVAIGDTGRIRRDCAKRYVEDCINRFNNRPNFRGEPLIPQGEEGSAQVSGSASAAPANPQPSTTAGNLVVNGGFEDGATGWTLGSGTVETTGDAVSEAKALIFDGAVSGVVVIAESDAIPIGNKSLLSTGTGIRVVSVSGGTASLRIIVTPSSGAGATSTAVSIAAPAAPFSRSMGAFTSDPLVTVRIKYELVAATGSPVVRLAIDDVSLVIA